MTRIHRIFGVAFLLASVAACSDDKKEGTMTVHGTVSSRVEVDNARAVAVGADGRVFWAYLDAHRDFTLTLPVGQSYRILVANQRAEGGQRTVGRLVLDGPNGTTPWLGANEALTIDLGTLRPAKPTTAAGAITPKCATCSGSGDDDDKDDDDKDDGNADHDDDYACHEKGGGYGKSGGGEHESCSSCGDDEGDDHDSDGAKKDDDECDVCKEGDAVDLKPSKKPGHECADKDGGEKKKGDYDDDKPCKKGKGDKKGSDGKGGSDGKSGSGSNDESSSDDGDGKSGGEASPRGGDGAKCGTTSECSSECSCVASRCATK